MEEEKINKYLDILNSVADKLIGGCLHSGNVAHDAPIKGYTIKNCVDKIRQAIKGEDTNEKDNV